jgi:hypothetical protein
MCENNSFVLLLTVIHIGCRRQLMKQNQSGITKRLVAAMLVTIAVVGVSALAIHTPTPNPNALARPLKSIQTDKATQFAFFGPPIYATRCVERVPSMTAESKASTENLKLIAAAF